MVRDLNWLLFSWMYFTYPLSLLQCAHNTSFSNVFQVWCILLISSCHEQVWSIISTERRSFRVNNERYLNFYGVPQFPMVSIAVKKPFTDPVKQNLALEIKMIAFNYRSIFRPSRIFIQKKYEVSSQYLPSKIKWYEKSFSTTTSSSVNIL
jgi:hypothetical protein